jgi:hypothetical protein
MSQFRTADLSLAATLLNEKYRLLDLDRSSQNVEFIFEESEKLPTTVASYWRDELMCPAQSLLASLKRAKRILHDYR